MGTIKIPYYYVVGKFKLSWSLEDEDSQDLIIVVPQGEEHELKSHKKHQQYQENSLCSMKIGVHLIAVLRAKISIPAGYLGEIRFSTTKWILIGVERRAR